LIWFKYFNLFFDSLLNQGTASYEKGHIQFIAPIGISFYIFQAISYTVDVYRGHVKKSYNFHSYYIYISFFPQLIAGPIVKAKDFLYQLNRKRKVNLKVTLSGFYFLIFGIFLKTVIADNIGHVVDKYWNLGYFIENGNLLAFSLASLFATQIFSDFSGYSLIAIGIGYILGFRLPSNFNWPYIAHTFSNFWNRWHISLSTWLKEYIYFPLGGNRRGSLLTYRNLLIVMIIGGFWHGGNYTFLIWGLIHGIALVIEKLFHSKLVRLNKHLYIGWFFWVHFVVLISWIFFRSENIKHSLLFTRTLLTGFITPDFSKPYWSDIGIAFLFTLPVIAMHIYHALIENFKFKALSPSWKGFSSAIMVIAIFLLYGNSNQFIYFQF
jgi:D-alanyl-lipoteichoic acid acyltransferase DltB (MBOAT superfamily)